MAPTLDGTHMPDARQLLSMPVKQVSFGTNAPGNVISVGSFTLSRGGLIEPVAPRRVSGLRAAASGPWSRG